jgi:hypothetical protein
VTLQIQKEKEDKICHQMILEEVELHLEDVHAKYDDIISKDRVIKDQAKRIEDVIVFEKNIDEMGVQSEEKPSNVKPHQHPHYQEIFQGSQEGGYQHYQGRRWNNYQYSWNKASQNHYSTIYYHRTTSTTNWRSDPDEYWWPPTYSNWLLVSVFVQQVLLYCFVIVGSTLLGFLESPQILQVDTSGLLPNPTGLFCMFSCQHILLYF